MTYVKEQNIMDKTEEDMDGQHADREANIRAIAYRLWEDEGHPEGSAERHWIAAEAIFEADDPERKSTEGEPPGDIRPSELEKPMATISDAARKRRANGSARSA